MRRYVIYGAGAIGGTIGARLAQSGARVVFVARGEHYQAMAAQGLRFESPESVVDLRVPAVEHPGLIDFSEDDVVLLCTKTPDTAAALRDLAEVLPDLLPVVCAQNGVANERLALRLFPDVYGMRVNVPASRLEAGTVRAYAAPVYGILDVGRFPSGADALAHELAADLTNSGFSSSADGAIMRWKYCKLLVNLANAIDAACGPRSPERDQLYELALAEGRSCLSSAGIDAAPPEEDWARRAVMRTHAAAERDEYPGNSSWQSLARGQATEVDYLNGEIVLLGRLHGVPTPVNEVLQSTMHRMTRDKAPPGSVPPAELLEQVAAQSDSRKAT